MPPPSDGEGLTYLELGPAMRQRRQQDPAEKISHGNDEETVLQTSLTTVSKALGKRDAQTTELHRQLREVRQSIWLRIKEARDANARLHGLLADPSRAPKPQAEALGRLQQEAKDLSSCLADSRAQEQQWATIAKRQKAFFMQNERVGKEPGDLLKKHPAGDIFLAPPPAIFDDDEQPSQEPMWDRRCNPYSADSWPFEPNGSQEPIGEDEDDDEWSEDDEEAGNDRQKPQEGP